MSKIVLLAALLPIASAFMPGSPLFAPRGMRLASSRTNLAASPSMELAIVTGARYADQCIQTVQVKPFWLVAWHLRAVVAACGWMTRDERIPDLRQWNPLSISFLNPKLSRAKLFTPAGLSATDLLLRFCAAAASARPSRWSWGSGQSLCVLALVWAEHLLSCCCEVCTRLRQLCIWCHYTRHVLQHMCVLGLFEMPS